MKLRSLAVNQFKKFTTPIRLEGIEDGLNVVVGPNEMGKSTLLDALRAVLFEKYSSRAQPIMALQNDRNQPPRWSNWYLSLMMVPTGSRSASSRDPMPDCRVPTDGA